MSFIACVDRRLCLRVAEFFPTRLISGVSRLFWVRPCHVLLKTAHFKMSPQFTNWLWVIMLISVGVWHWFKAMCCVDWCPKCIDFWLLSFRSSLVIGWFRAWKSPQHSAVIQDGETTPVRFLSLVTPNTRFTRLNIHNVEPKGAPWPKKEKFLFHSVILFFIRLCKWASSSHSHGNYLETKSSNTLLFPVR